LQLQTNETISEVALAKDDIAGLVHLLLVLVCDSGLQHAKANDLGSTLPLSSVWLGESQSGDALLGLEVGAVKLSFSLPREQLARLWQAILTASAAGSLPM
jgi:hypothetical protein